MQDIRFIRVIHLLRLQTLFYCQSFTEYLTDNTAKTLIWTAAALIPAVTGLSRINTHNHFPTDVIVGYIVGAAIGYLIPELHKYENENNISAAPQEFIHKPIFGFQISFRIYKGDWNADINTGSLFRRKSLRDVIAHDEKLWKYNFYVEAKQKPGRSPGWAKIHSVNPNVRGAINISWQSRVKILTCRVITKGTGKPAMIIRWLYEISPCQIFTKHRIDYYCAEIIEILNSRYWMTRKKY